MADDIIIKVRLDGAKDQLNTLNALQEEINALAQEKKKLTKAEQLARRRERYYQRQTKQVPKVGGIDGYEPTQAHICMPEDAAIGDMIENVLRFEWPQRSPQIFKGLTNRERMLFYVRRKRRMERELQEELA